MATVDLNEIPQELKPLTPFLQRAQELKVKDPTMSYWCTYYAVQQGVHLKPREKMSRMYLLKLMSPLEAIRGDASSTVVTSNDAACIYIEDFALRVFDAADNEDRRGEASRGTAKKFLAAANFLELLKVFEEASQSSDTPSASTQSAFSQHKDKIRYAKWKAADIAKAFREGRRPTPGPANAPEAMHRSEFEPMYGPRQDPQWTLPSQQPQFSRDSSNNTSPHAMSPVGGSRDPSRSPGMRNSAPLPLSTLNGSDSAPNGPHSRSQSQIVGMSTPIKGGDNRLGVSPGGWSTSATPGFDESARRPATGMPRPENSPSRMPDGRRLPEDTKSYSPRPYPPTPALRLTALQQDDVDEAVGSSNAMNRQSPRRPDFRNTNSGGVQRQNGIGKQANMDDGGDGSGRDELGPLRTNEEKAAGSKKVRWTPSVSGGDSTIASSSPPGSPRSPLGELPTLPESSDSSSNGEHKKGIRFSGTNAAGQHITPPSSVEDHAVKPNGMPKGVNNPLPQPPRAPINPYAEDPQPKTSPPRFDGARLVAPQPGSQGGSGQSTPTLPTQPLRRSPLPPPSNLPLGNAKGVVSPPTNGLAFPAASAPTSPSAVGYGPPVVHPGRNRRASSAAAEGGAAAFAMSSIAPPIVKPFVPRFGGNGSTDSSPAGSTLVNSISSLGRPKGLGYSPPLKALTPPPPSNAVVVYNGSGSGSGSNTPKPLPKTLPFRLISAAKKHSKFAASALEFDDLETARAELLAALAILNGDKTE